MTEIAPARPFQSFAKMVFIGFVVLEVFLGFILLQKDSAYQNAFCSVDDTYYYLQTAWNHKECGFPTFDGIHATNGFHFAWYLILYGLSFAVTDKAQMLPLAIGAGIALNAACFAFIHAIGRRLESPKIAVALASLWFMVSLPTLSFTKGMENSLHAFSLWWLCFELTRFSSQSIGNVPRSLIRLTLVLILNAWTRLDAGILSAVVFATVAFRSFCRSSGSGERAQGLGRAIIWSCALAGAGLFIQVACFHHWAGTFIPISGLIKSAGIFPVREYASSFGKLWVLLRMSTPILPFVDKILVPSACWLAVGMVLAGAWFPRKKGAPCGLHRLTAITLPLGGGTLAYLAYYLGSSAAQFAFWYFTPAIVLCVVCLGAIFVCGAETLELRTRRRFVSEIACVALVAGALLLCLLRLAINLRHSAGGTAYAVRYEAAGWIRANLPADAVLASWNAGQLGFFSHRTVINLDGLVNDRRYFEEVLKGRRALPEYLRENRVDYVVDYYDYSSDHFTANLPVVQSFPMPAVRGGGALRVWAFKDQPAGRRGGRPISPPQLSGGNGNSARDDGS